MLNDKEIRLCWIHSSFLCLNKDQFQPQSQSILIEFEGQSQLVVNYAVEQELSSVIKQNISV